MPNNRISLLTLAALVFFPAPLLAQQEVTDDLLKQWWSQLARPNVASIQASLNFAANPEDSVRFLESVLQPLSLDEESFDTLLLDLASDDEDTWQRAYQTFGYQDPRLYADLTTLMDLVPESPVRERMVGVLSGWPLKNFHDDKRGERWMVGDVALRETGDNTFNFRSDGRAWWAETDVAKLGVSNGKPAWTRAARAICILEEIGTEPAMELIRKLASGDNQAPPTQVALKVTKADSNDTEPDDEVSAEQLQAWWKQLGRSDSGSTRAALNFVRHPLPTTRFFSEQLQPVSLDEPKFDALLLDLASPDDATWQAAYRDLQYFDPRLHADLVTLMTLVPEDPGRMRMIGILSCWSLESIVSDVYGIKDSSGIQLREIGDASFNFSGDHGSWWAEANVANLGNATNSKPSWTQAIHAIAILQQLDTTQASEIIQRMAEGHDEAGPTRQAVQAIRELRTK